MRSKRLRKIVAFAMITASLSAINLLGSGNNNLDNFKFIYKASAASTGERPHFEGNYVVVDGIKYHKISDTTVAVNHGEDYSTRLITIPSQINVDGVRYKVTKIENYAFRGESENGAYKSYNATKVVIPNSVQEGIGSSAFYSLDKVESLDLTNVKVQNYKSSGITLDGTAAVNPAIDNKCLNGMKSIDRVKVPSIIKQGQYRSGYGCYDLNYVISDSRLAKPVVFVDENNKILSQWYIADSVRITELQDNPVKDGYTFGGWKSETVTNTEYAYSDSVTYTKYTPTYEEKQSISDFEDRFKNNLENTALGYTTKESDIEEIIKKSLTYDNITYEIKNFRIVEPQWDSRGAVRCTVSAKNTLNNETVDIDVDRYITELVSDAKLEEIIKNMPITDKTTKEDLENYLKDKLDDNGLRITINDICKYW